MKIGTHNGMHHPDDVTACMILCELYPGSEVVRTRDSVLLSECDFLVDIGGQYDVSKKIFDHHQKDSPIRPCGSPYSSAGLIWKHYGKEYIKLIIPTIEENQLHSIWSVLDEEFFLVGDELDNHVRQNENNDIFSFILDISDTSDDMFIKAMEIIKLFLVSKIEKYHKLICDNKLIQDAISIAVMEDKNYVILPHEMNTDIICNSTGIFFAIFPYSDGTTIMIRCLGKDYNKLDIVRPFKKVFCGLMGIDLVNYTDNSNLLFVHQKGFCGGATTVEDAISMINMTE